MHLIPAHRVLSRDVTPEDVARVKADAAIMVVVTKIPYGLYANAYAIAHPQVTDQDPLKFFVTKDNEIICNPVITYASKLKRPMEEGCMTFADKKKKAMFRPYKITVEFQYITENGTLSEKISDTFKGIEAQVFQHEIEHFEGKYIYDEE